MARRCSTICLPSSKDDYLRVVDSPAEFRRWIGQTFRTAPEPFPRDFQHGYTLKDRRRSSRSGRDSPGVGEFVYAGGGPAVLPARVAGDPQPGQVDRRFRDPFGEGVECVPRTGSAELLAATEATVGVDRAADRSRVGGRAGEEVVRPSEGVRTSLSSSGRSPDEQHAGSCDAFDGSVLRRRPAPARPAAIRRVPLPGVGAAVQLPTVEPGGDAGRQRVAQSG